MGKVVLVTGGSRGIGAAVCRLAARDGWDVAIAYRQRAEAAARVAEDVRAQGRRVVVLPCDITDRRAVCAAFDQTANELGYVEALVSNAGVIHKAAPLADIPPEEIRRIVETDLLAHILCNREAVRRMARSRGGRGGVIVNISSMAVQLNGAGGFVPYAAAKAGIDLLTAGLGKEVAAEGIRINALRPGLIDTDMQADTGVPERVQRFGPTVPLGRAGRPEEVAEAVVWLLSDKASYVAATVFNVSGAR